MWWRQRERYDIRIGEDIMLSEQLSMVIKWEYWM